MALIHEVLTSTLVESVWRGRRTFERVRVWGLHQLASFWIAVCFHAPASLRRALSEGLGIASSPYPVPACAPQSFFARSQRLSWQFMADLFHAFRARAVAQAPRAFAKELRPLLRRFHAIEAVDGSRLDPVRRRLKILWKGRESVIPGCLLAFYDLATGTVARLTFHPQAMASEFKNAVKAFAGIPSATLIVGDRLYGVVRFFAALSSHGLFGVSRRFSVVTIRPVRRLSRKLHEGAVLEDWEVLAGSAQTAKPQTLRHICLKRKGKAAIELLTNVLDPDRLSAAEALMLYRHRWTIERLFSDLKEVLSIHRLYGANVNAVATQVYAALILHTALRIAQATAAREARVQPEEISTKKFFPKAATASANLIGSECAFLAVARLNPEFELREPNWHRMKYASTTLKDVRVEVRRSRKGRGRRRPGIRAWRAWPPGALKRPP
jgi:hypothetical protein